MLHCVHFQTKDTTLYLFRGPKCYIVFSLKDESTTLRYYTYFDEKCLKCCLCVFAGVDRF